MKVALLLLPMLLVVAAYQDDSNEVIDSIKDLGEDMIEDTGSVINAGQKSLSDGLSNLENSLKSHLDDEDYDENDYTGNEYDICDDEDSDDCSDESNGHKHPLLRFAYYVLRYAIAKVFYRG